MMEQAAHGRSRKGGDELFFGPFQGMHRARMVKPLDGAQWTGITTSIAADLLKAGKVQAILTMVSDSNDRWKPKPALITSASDMDRARGMRMGFAPLLALLEEAQARSFLA